MQKLIVWLIISIIVVMNIVACTHAYTFTHFTDKNVVKTKDARLLPFHAKIKTLLFGINNPRPVNTSFPLQSYKTVQLHSYESIELWQIYTSVQPKGTVVLFHGYSGSKSGLLDKSDEFLKLGYHTVLVDFPGSGGSTGKQTTIGYKEAEIVKVCFTYLQKAGENHIFLFGTSMGAVAILKALHDYKLNPSGIILECPFGTMYKTTVSRFHTMQVPEFPFAPLLVFWGGVINGFWAFSHNPIMYAQKVQCPTLLLYGEQDEKVTKAEITAIYQNLKGIKYLSTFKNAGHENYLLEYKPQWIKVTKQFLSKI